MAEAKAKAEASTAEKNNKMVTIRIPRDPMDERNYVMVGINGVNYKIKRGVPVEVPEAVAEMLDFSDSMAAEADEYREQLLRGTDGNGMTKMNY